MTGTGKYSQEVRERDRPCTGLVLLRGEQEGEPSESSVREISGSLQVSTASR